MNGMKLFGIVILSLFFLSSVQAVVVTDVTTNDLSQQQIQNFASINARLVDLANQIESQRIDDMNARANMLQKSDLSFIFNNVDNIVKLGNQDQLVSELVVVIVAFCLFLILIGKNMLPQHRKEDKLSTTKENLRLVKNNQRLSAENGKLLKKIEELRKPPVKKGWFKKKVEPVPSTPLKVAFVDPDSNLSPNIRELKREFNDPNAKWREELIRAQERVKVLEELSRIKGGV